MSELIPKTSPQRGEIPSALMPLAFPDKKPRTVKHGKDWVAQTKPSIIQQTSPARAISELIGSLGLASFFVPSKNHSLSSLLTTGGVIATIVTWALEPDLNPDKSKEGKAQLPESETVTDKTNTNPDIPQSKRYDAPDGTTIIVNGGTVSIVVNNIISNPAAETPLPSSIPSDESIPVEPGPDPTKSPEDKPRVPTSPGTTEIPGSSEDTESMSLEDLIKTVKMKSNSITKRIKAIDEIIKRYPELGVDQKEQVVEAFIFTLGNGKAANDRRHDNVRNHIIDKELFSVLTVEPTERIIRLLINALEEDSIEPPFKTQIAYRIADIDKTKITLSAPSIGELKAKFDRLRETVESKIIQEPLNAEAASQIPLLTATLLKKDKIEDQELPRHIALLSIALRILTYPQTKEEILPAS